MELNEVLKYQLDSSAKQVDKVIEGLSEEHWDAKLRPDCMSPREAVAHLTECYVAAQKDAAGKEHEWGTYVPQDTSSRALTDEMRAQRQKMSDALVAAADEKAIKAATQYAVLHDAYHVGQLATLRIGIEPGWDAYSIYS